MPSKAARIFHNNSRTFNCPHHDYHFGSSSWLWILQIGGKMLINRHHGQFFSVISASLLFLIAIVRRVHADGSCVVKVDLTMAPVCNGKDYKTCTETYASQCSWSGALPTTTTWPAVPHLEPDWSTTGCKCLYKGKDQRHWGKGCFDHTQCDMQAACYSNKAICESLSNEGACIGALKF